MPKPANKPIIAVDVDDVLLPYGSGLLDYSNKKYKTKLEYENLTSLDLSKSLEITSEDFLQHLFDYVQNHQFKLLPAEGSEIALNRLKKKYRICIITYRSQPLYKTTHAWLNEHFPGVFDQVNMIGGKVFGDHKSKAEVCKEIGASWLIEDQLKPALDAAESGIDVLLFGNYPWNHIDTLPKNMTRVSNWQEVLEYFENESAR
jgi:uncharacterized HAD superfamily protein